MKCARGSGAVRRWGVVDDDRAFGKNPGRIPPIDCTVMQLKDRIAGADPIAGVRLHDDANRRIDVVVDLVAAGAEDDRRAADELGIDPAT